MPSTSLALRPASRMALRMASTAMARVERPDPREYSVSPTPTMQYLSRRWLIASPCRNRSRSAASPRSGRSLAAAARHGGHHTQSDVHAAGNPALAGEEPRPAAQPARRRARAERVGAVGERAQQHEEQAEPEDLRARTAAREIDELLLDGAAEPRIFGVPRVGGVSGV